MIRAQFGVRHQRAVRISHKVLLSPQAKLRSSLRVGEAKWAKKYRSTDLPALRFLSQHHDELCDSDYENEEGEIPPPHLGNDCCDHNLIGSLHPL